MTYAVVVHQSDDHSDIIAEYDEYNSAWDCFSETISDDWYKKNVESVELFEWDNDTVLWHSFTEE